MSSVFLSYSSTAYPIDPIFGEKQFEMYGNAAAFRSPILFLVREYRYVLIHPDDFRHNEDLCFKVATYLYHHKTEENGMVVTYFFGDINDCKEVGDDFSNQICKYVSYEMVDEWYPKNLNEINDYVINFFLDKQRYYGQDFLLNEYDMHYLFFIPKTLNDYEFLQSKGFIIKQLKEKNLITQHILGDNKTSITITDTAVDMFQKASDKLNSKIAFIAMKFNGNEERIKAIQDAIALSGYEPRIMNEYETNNWIMPEIFHQIQLSKFVVVDLSIRCDGAYYEAGYAQAIGKEVIHIYDRREEKNNPLHFDVAQKSTVIYDDFEDLKIKLINRIAATVN